MKSYLTEDECICVMLIMMITPIIFYEWFDIYHSCIQASTNTYEQLICRQTLIQDALDMIELS